LFIFNAWVGTLQTEKNTDKFTAEARWGFLVEKGLMGMDNKNTRNNSKKYSIKENKPG
jgi:hypothetical protein